MEISEREYEELKQQIRVLSEKVNCIEKPRRELHDLITELPIDLVHRSNEQIPIFEYTKSAQSDAWKLFMQLAKIVHTESYKFYMDKAGYGINERPYIRMCGKHTYPRRIAEMSNEQIDISVQMLNELIPIYNKYFMKMHETVLYCDNPEGIFRKIYVERVEE